MVFHPNLGCSPSSIYLPPHAIFTESTQFMVGEDGEDGEAPMAAYSVMVGC